MSLKSGIERHVYTVDVIGSIPVGPTTTECPRFIAGAFLVFERPSLSLSEPMSVAVGSMQDLSDRWGQRFPHEVEQHVKRAS